MPDYTLNALIRRLSETVAWYNLELDVANPAATCRSQELKADSSFFVSSASAPGNDFTTKYKNVVHQNFQIVESIAARRATILGSRPRQEEQEIRSTAASGRLLLFDPFCSTGDGLSAGDSEGFFDQDDNPPWDTFLQYFIDPRDDKTNGFSRAALCDGVICWIPGPFVKLADDGIRCNVLGSIKWLSNPGLQLPELLKELVQFVEGTAASS
jgi:hypothetical protein